MVMQLYTLGVSVPGMLIFYQMESRPRYQNYDPYKQKSAHTFGILFAKH